MQKLPFMPHCTKQKLMTLHFLESKGIASHWGSSEEMNYWWVLCVADNAKQVSICTYVHYLGQHPDSIQYFPLPEPRKHMTNMLYSRYLVSLWEDILLKRKITILLLYTSTASADKISCSEQLVPQSSYLTVQAILFWSLRAATDSSSNLYSTAAFISIGITFPGPDCLILLLLFWNGHCKT